MNRRLHNLAPFIRPIFLTLATSSDSMVRKIKPWLSKNESRFYRDKQAKPTKRRQVLINRFIAEVHWAQGTLPIRTNRELTRYSGDLGEQVSVENGINLKVIWFDEVEDLLEVVFSCSNGFFSGQAEIYVSRDDLSEFADALTRFPSRPDDSRDFELGTFNPDHADGGARMHFFCTDAAGHAVVEVKLRGDACRALGEMQSVALRIPIQAAGVDEFIKQLQGIGKTLGASAHLPQAAS